MKNIICFICIILVLTNCTFNKEFNQPVIGIFYINDSIFFEGNLDSLGIDKKLVNKIVLGSMDYSYKSIPKRLNEFENLKTLSLALNDVEEFPCGMTILAQIESLSFHMNPIKSINLCVEEYKNLKYLDLAGTDIDSVPENICELKHLIRISLYNTGVSYIPDCLNELTDLTEVILCGEPDMPERKCKIPNLERKRLKELMPEVNIVFEFNDSF